MVRSVVALIAGFAIMTFTVLVAAVVTALAMGVEAGAPSPAFLGVTLACGALAAAFGGYSTAALAPQRPGGHTVILAAMILLMGISNAVSPRPGQPGWFLLAAMLLSPLAAIAGGQLRLRRKPAPSHQGALP